MTHRRVERKKSKAKETKQRQDKKVKSISQSPSVAAILFCHANPVLFLSLLCSVLFTASFRRNAILACLSVMSTSAHSIIFTFEPSHANPSNLQNPWTQLQSRRKSQNTFPIHPQPKSMLHISKLSILPVEPHQDTSGFFVSLGPSEILCSLGPWLSTAVVNSLCALALVFNASASGPL